jgi:hypothetical protein
MVLAFTIMVLARNIIGTCVLFHDSFLVLVTHLFLFLIAFSSLFHHFLSVLGKSRCIDPPLPFAAVPPTVVLLASTPSTPSYTIILVIMAYNMPMVDSASTPVVVPVTMVVLALTPS